MGHVCVVRLLAGLALLSAFACRGEADVFIGGPDRPSVETVEPVTFSARGLTEVVVRGSHLDSVYAVRVGERDAEILSIDEDELRISTPRMVAGTADLVLTSDVDEIRLPGFLEVRPISLSFEEVTPAPYTAPQTGATAAAVGDFDGDGDPDVVVGGETPDVAALLLNEHGILRDALVLDPGRLVSPGGVRSILVGDFDADGDVDLLFATAKDQPAKLYLNDGSARFLEGPELPASLFTATRGHVADFDADGLLDVALVDGADGEPAVHVLLNDWMAPGTPHALVPVDGAMFAGAGVIAADVSSVDFDGDADIDLLLVHARPEHARGRAYSVLRNDGRAQFTLDEAASSAATAGARRVAALDCEGDGDWDVFLAGNEQDRLLENQNGNFVEVTDEALPVDDSRVGDVVAQDLDLDGVPELVIANVGAQNRLYVSRSGARMRDETLRLPIARDDTVAVLVVDFDADGADDLFFLNAVGPSKLLRSFDEEH